MRKYGHVTVGGTFDRLHKGHKTLIDRAFALGEKVSLGLSSEELYQKKTLFTVIEDYETRKVHLTNYLKSKGYYQRVQIIPLVDFYGTTLTDESIEAVIVTEDTVENARRINQARTDKNWQLLDIITVPLVKAEDGGKITSERIRMGEIDDDGHDYSTLLEKKEQLILPESLRQELRKPLGRVIEGGLDEVTETADKVRNIIKNSHTILSISVGDCITKSLADVGLDPDVKIIDNKTRRKIVGNKTSTGDNDPGTINSKTALVIRNLLDDFIRTKNRQILVINGEEDLLALPAILVAPLGSVVLYGQFDLGVVVVEVTDQKKKEVEALLKKFI